MLAIYGFQLAKLKRQKELQALSFIGGSEKNSIKIIKSIYSGSSLQAVMPILQNKGEHLLGFISVQEAKEPSRILTAEMQKNQSLSAVVVCGEKVYAYRWQDGKAIDEEIRVENVDFLALKQNGMLRQADDGYYSMRLKVVAGNLSEGEFIHISEMARRFSNGKIHITSRQGIELPFVHIADLEEFFDALREKKLEMGASGPRVRAVIGCQGNAVCPNGLINTADLTQKIGKQFFGKELPHKFKIAVTGCPNNCIKADENDLGIKGTAKISFQEENCRHCGACARVCPVGAVTVTKTSTVIDKDRCIGCGKCARSCAFHALTAKYGYRLSFGGTFGRNLVIGTALYPFVESDEEVLRIIAATLKFFEKNGRPKERINKTIARIGWDKFKDSLQ